MGEPESAEFVRRARQGDAGAFEWLVARHERMVLRTALRLVGTRDAAQDAAQEAFLRLHRSLARFDESRDLAPWLYRIVVNACRDLARRAPRNHVAMDEVGELPASRDGAQAIEDALVRADRLRLVQAALETLPEKERSALVLRDLEGLPTAEVARILSSSVGTVRSQVSTARLKVKAFLERRGARR